MSRKQDEPDGGFTLVETMVALFIIVGILLASLYLIAAYFASSQTSLAKVRGVQLASERIELFKAVPYTSLGFYTDDNAPSCSSATPAAPAQCRGQAPVVLGAVRGTDTAAPRPAWTGTQPAGNVTYRVTTFLTWSQPVAVAGGIKHIVVVVDWSVPGRPASAVLEAFRSPTGTDVGTTQVAAGAPGAPSAPSTTAPTAAATTSATAASVVTVTGASPSAMCIVPGSPATTKSTQYVYVSVTNAGIGDDISMNWTRGSNYPSGEVWNTSPGTSSNGSASVSFTLTVPAGTDVGTIAAGGSFSYTITQIRQSDGAVASVSGTSTTATAC